MNDRSVTVTAVEKVLIVRSNASRHNQRPSLSHCFDVIGRRNGRNWSQKSSLVSSSLAYDMHGQGSVTANFRAAYSTVTPRTCQNKNKKN
jgi:hypothetical protein